MRLRATRRLTGQGTLRLPWDAMTVPIVLIDKLRDVFSACVLLVRREGNPMMDFGSGP